MNKLTSEMEATAFSSEATTSAVRLCIDLDQAFADQAFAEFSKHLNNYKSRPAARVSLVTTPCVCKLYQ